MQFILHNYTIKILAFIVAVFIWFFVITENDYETILEIPISTTNLPEGKVILNDIAEFVKIKIKGTGKDLIALGFNSNARVELDLSDVDKNKTFQLETKDVFLSRSSGFITTEEILMPNEISVVLDDFLEKKVPITPKLNFKPASGYTQVGKIRTLPDSVKISGPKSEINKISEISAETEQIFENLKSDLKTSIPLKLPVSQKIKISAQQTVVYINIQKLVELEFKGVSVKIKNIPNNTSLYVVPSTLQLTLIGGGNILTYIDHNDIVAYLDYNRIQNITDKEYPVVIQTPAGVKFRDVRPKTFRVVYEK